MAIEVRHLMFDEDEVTSALVAYDRRSRPHSRAMTVADMRLDDFPTMKAYLTMKTPDGAIDVVEVDEEDVGIAVAEQFAGHARRFGAGLVRGRVIGLSVWTRNSATGSHGQSSAGKSGPPKSGHDKLSLSDLPISDVLRCAHAARAPSIT